MTDYNARQCNHCSRKRDDDTFDFLEQKNRRQLDYTERLEEDHTYAGLNGSYLLKTQSVLRVDEIILFSTCLIFPASQKMSSLINRLQFKLTILCRQNKMPTTPMKMKNSVLTSLRKRKKRKRWMGKM